MMKPRSVVSGQWSVVLCLLLAFSNRAMTTDHEQPTTDKFAVIIGGVGGDPAYAQRFADWTQAMYRLLRDQLDFTEDHIFYLTATPAEAARSTTAKATADAVQSTFQQLKTRATPRSIIFVFLVGHGSFENQQAKLNLVGPDLTAEAFNQWLDALPTQRVILVNAASASGPFINALSRPGRIIITATRSGQERNATTFAEFFIQAFKENQADLDKNGRVSLLEAFTYANKMTGQWYQQQGRLATEHPLLDDNGDKVGHSEATDGDGGLAGATYLDSRPLVQAAGDRQWQHLMSEKEDLEQSIEALKARKTAITSAAYEAELERLLIQLAQVNQKIKARQK